MAAFEWAVSGLYKVPAQVAGEVCEQLERSEQGLSPQTLVDASRDERAPLHSVFEWDDKKAAEGFRRSQAQTLIRSLVVKTVRESGETVNDRQFVSAPGGESRYVRTEVAFSRADFEKHLMKQALSDMVSFCAKYRRLQELSGVIGAMQTALNAPVA